jgi:hypothetical protein
VSRILSLGTVTALLIFLTVGCTMPRTPIASGIYIKASDGMYANAGEIPATVKVGEATATGLLGVTWGDSSIDTARKNGQIKKIYYVDYDTFGILGVYAKVTTKVYGE